jgi:hypothetical protein
MIQISFVTNTRLDWGARDYTHGESPLFSHIPSLDLLCSRSLELELMMKGRPGSLELTQFQSMTLGSPPSSRVVHKDQWLMRQKLDDEREGSSDNGC